MPIVLCKRRASKNMMEVVRLFGNVAYGSKKPWERPRIGMKAKNGELAEMIDSKKISGLPSMTLSELDRILRGEHQTWGIYSVDRFGENFFQVKLVGCPIVGLKWCQRGDFAVDMYYPEAMIEIQVNDPGSVIWWMVAERESYSAPMHLGGLMTATA